jgi:hypothetical protein
MKHILIRSEHLKKKKMKTPNCKIKAKTTIIWKNITKLLTTKKYGRRIFG